MTKKHFIQMAQGFKGLLECTDSDEARSGIILSIELFCAVAAGVNGRFDRDRFRAACGL